MTAAANTMTTMVESTPFVIHLVKQPQEQASVIAEPLIEQLADIIERHKNDQKPLSLTLRMTCIDLCSLALDDPTALQILASKVREIGDILRCPLDLSPLEEDFVIVNGREIWPAKLLAHYRALGGTCSPYDKQDFCSEEPHLFAKEVIIWKKALLQAVPEFVQLYPANKNDCWIDPAAPQKTSSCAARKIYRKLAQNALEREKLLRMAETFENGNTHFQHSMRVTEKSTQSGLATIQHGMNARIEQLKKSYEFALNALQTCLIQSDNNFEKFKEDVERIIESNTVNIREVLAEGEHIVHQQIKETREIHQHIVSDMQQLLDAATRDNDALCIRVKESEERIGLLEERLRFLQQRLEQLSRENAANAAAAASDGGGGSCTIM